MKRKNIEKLRRDRCYIHATLCDKRL